MEGLEQMPEEITYRKASHTGDDSGTTFLYSLPSGKTPLGPEPAGGFFVFWAPVSIPTHKDLESFYKIVPEEEVEKGDVMRHIESAIGHIDTAIEFVDDIADKDSTFSLVGEDLEALWKMRENFNDEFRTVLIFLKIAFKNYKYENYAENQLNAIKEVLKILGKIGLSETDKVNCRQILSENKIDILSPLRTSGQFEIIFRKK